MGLTFHRILDLYGVNSADTKLVRHSNSEIPILETFKNNLLKFEGYQSFQSRNKFGGADHIAVFSPSQGTSALFLGVWDILGCTDNVEEHTDLRQIIDDYNFPSSWHEGISYYHLKKNPSPDELSERLLIDWGGSTVSWVQGKDKQIIELRRQNSIGKFASYDQVQINYQDLKILCSDKAANIDWVNALSAVNGVYLIKDCSTGKLYVGSAYGSSGILGRWSAYAADGHGENIGLMNLDPSNFEFSILEIVSSTVAESDVIHRENRWKAKLGSIEFGLNLN